MRSWLCPQENDLEIAVMKILRRLFIGLGVVLALLLLAIWIVLPPVNVPLGMLGNFFPDYVEPPRVDDATVSARLKVRKGYQVNLFAAGIKDARVLRATDANHLLVASPGTGQVLILYSDINGDGRSDGYDVVLEGLNGPNGLDLYKGFLYVAEQDGIGRVPFDGRQTLGDYEVLVQGLPAGGNHWKKTLRIGPDGLMYVAVGSSCNVCEENDVRRAALLQYQLDGSGEKLFATGLRNSAGFDWSPEDGQLYATDNGRDLLGDDFPPCELNRIQAGGFYGWPYANGDRIPDPDLGSGKETLIAESIPPVFDFPAHNAPLGIVFLRSPTHRSDMAGAALVALHGSWNRSRKDGYKVVSLQWDVNGIVAQDFLTGFLLNDDVIGRPAEIAEDRQGNIYVSDDFANAIYRVSRTERAL
ncbi:MAG: PQQ-dependent sugar dehydrogenase [Pseudomonadota bacterium]|nr:PQQ-dependent sugar dehydrogenase [Pseudomonadota bacterium]